MEGNGFAKLAQQYEEAGYKIAGVSTNSVAANAKFAEEEHFPYVLLCDTKLDLVTMFGSRCCFLPFAGRGTFVVDTGGSLVKRIPSFSPASGPGKLLEELACQEMADAGVGA